MVCTGGVVSRAGYLDEARELATDALEVTGRGRPRALRCLGKVERRLRQISAAETYLRQAYNAACELGDGSEQIRVLRELSAAQALGAEPAVGADTADDALRLCDRRPDTGKRLRAGVLWSKGSALLYAGDLDRAERAFQDAEQIASEADQHLWMAWIGQGRSRVALEAGHFDESKRFTTEALDRFRGMRHRYGIAHCRLLLGEICRAEGQWQEAARTLEDALETFQNCGDQWMTGVAMHTLALNRRDQGYPDAAALFEEARKFTTRCQRVPSRGDLACRIYHRVSR